MASGDVGDPGERGHGVLLGMSSQHDPVYVVPGHRVGEQEGDKMAR